ncbi:MAG: hypothetical protein KJ843_13905 [Alphaproteobacteria bacterium]|nr:hypothetical protein [Alphaproteobacteria bacterium]MBU2337082.1 hypothetical protein [Alphaproteobacteria bacterium]
MNLAADFDLSVDPDHATMLEEVSRFSESELESLREDDGIAERTAEGRLEELGLESLEDQPPLLDALVAEELARGDLRIATNHVRRLYASRCLSLAPPSIAARLALALSDPAARLACVQTTGGRNRHQELQAEVTLSVPAGRSDEWCLRFAHAQADVDLVALEAQEELVWAAKAHQMHVSLWTSLIVGGMRRGLDASLDYARTRRSFGRPIVQHQAVAIRLADMSLALDGCKLLSWQFSREADGDWSLSPGDAAAGVSEAAARFASDLVQIHGAHGYVAGGVANRIFRELHVAARRLNA